MPLEGATALLEDLRAREIIDATGGPGEGADWLVPGGFRRLRIDDPGRPVLYANQVGGFRVACPRDPGNVVRAFRQALIGWKAGGPRSMNCPACGDVHALEALDYAPAAAFGRLSIAIGEVEDANPGPDVQALIARFLGPCTLIRIRV